MSNGKSSGSKKGSPGNAVGGLDPIQLAGILVAAVAILGLIWLVASNLRPAGSPSATGNGAPGSNPGQSSISQTPAPAGTPKQWTSPPPMTIDLTRQYIATVTMAKGGQFVIQLLPQKAPVTVNSFVFLANQGFYNGVTFHRVLEGFMAQGGDPTGTGGGGPGYQFQNERNDLVFDKAGVVAMANAGPDTNGSQFFITFGPNQLSEADYTIFGQVLSGMDVVNGITRRDPNQNPTTPGDAMATVIITEK